MGKRHASQYANFGSLLEKNFITDTGMEWADAHFLPL